MSSVYANDVDHHTIIKRWMTLWFYLEVIIIMLLCLFVSFRPCLGAAVTFPWVIAFIIIICLSVLLEAVIGSVRRTSK